MSLLNCEIIEGRQLTGCVKSNVGGIETVYIANHNDIDAIVIEDGNVYTGSTVEQIVDIQMKAGKDFFIFDTVKNTSSYNQTIEANVQNGTLSFIPTVELIFNKLDAQTRNLIQLLSVSLVDIIVKDSNANYFYFGRQRGMDLTGAEMTSGVENLDRNGSVLTFTGSESESIRSIYIDGTDGVLSSDGVQLESSNVVFTSY